MAITNHRFIVKIYAILEIILRKGVDVMKQNKNKKKPIVLVILDGFGYRKERQFNAIAQANTPHLDHWLATYPHTLLHASGTAVGLLDGYIGNSEVGHLTIGAGRIIPQAASIIHEAIEQKTFFNHPLLNQKLSHLKASGKTLHLMGLLSDAGVHSHIEDLFAFLDVAKQQGITNIIVHPFLDGRDTPPQSARNYLQQLDEKLKQLGCGIIGTLHGRFYAMDRDSNWNRVEKSYRVLTESSGAVPITWHEVIKLNYDAGITDEFIPPTQLSSSGTIQPGDGIIFFNFRPDRARQLTRCFIEEDFQPFATKKLSLCFFITPTNYNSFPQTDILFPTEPIKNTLKDILAQHSKTMLSVAETEKYAHVTYFFTGGREEILPNEIRIIIPSIPAKNYVDTPAMSAPTITEMIIKSLKKIPKDFYLVNYANADMVGHSGNFDATVKAIECLDEELSKLYAVIVEEMDGTLIITADHGNAELMVDSETGQPHTAHTTSPVPFIYIKKGLSDNYKLNLTQLADIAPFILGLMELPVPPEMGK